MRSLIVTGGAQGIGASIADMAAARGYRVGVLDLDAAAAGEAVDKLTNAVALCADVTDTDSMAAAIAEFGHVDVFVNNAGILRTGPLIDHSPEDFQAVIQVNLVGAFVAAQAAARSMRGSGGTIVNMSSINASQPSPNAGAYVAAKAGLEALTRQMSLEWSEFGIRVNAVAPGFVHAGMSNPFYTDEAVRERRALAVPLGRLGTAEDIAKAVLFLASEDADYITGQTLTVDGGLGNSVLKQLPRE